MDLDHVRPGQRDHRPEAGLAPLLGHVGQALVRQGKVDLVGLGRMVLSYPDLPADAYQPVFTTEQVRQAVSNIPSHEEVSRLVEQMGLPPSRALEFKRRMILTQMCEKQPNGHLTS